MPGSDRIRVLLVSPSLGAYGGIEAFVLAIAETLGRDPRIELCVCFKRVKSFVLDPTFAEQCRPFPVTFCDRASRALWRAIAWADVVHGQNASPDVAIAAVILRKPLAISVHNVLPRTPVSRRWSWRFAASLAKVRWYNSSFVWKTWEPDRPRVGSRFVPPLSRLSTAFVSHEARTGFVFLGRLVPGKGVEILLDAYDQSGLDPIRWPLTILGAGPLRVPLEQRSIRGVRFEGFVGGDIKDRARARAKWLVVPSHWGEPFGLVAVEARHVGVPCVIARDGGLPEAAGLDALVCDPGDVAGLRDALRAAAAMSEDEYRSRSVRTQRDLAAEIVPLSFYAEAYFQLARGREASGRLTESHPAP